MNIEPEISKLTKSVNFFTLVGWILILLGCIVLAYGIYSFNNLQIDETNNPFQLNLLGDFLAGSVGPIWSLAGLIFIYISFLGQKQQLLYNKEEIKITREEIVKQREEMQTQNDTLKQQKFENTFFELLKHLNDTVSKLKIANNPKWDGKMSFKFFYDSLQDKMYTERQVLTLPDLDETMGIFNDLFIQYRHSLFPYHDLIRTIFVLIDRSEIKNKEFYITILSTQLSDYEKIFLFYGGLSKDFATGKNLALLTTKYSFFSNLNSDLLIDQSHLTPYL